MKKITFLIFIFCLLLTTSCSSPTTTKPIGNKQNEIHLDYILFKVQDIKTSTLNEETVNVITATVSKNFNKLLNVETDYSKYIQNTIDNKTFIKLIIGDEYAKYIQKDMEFLYKLNDLQTINEEEVFDIRSNEYTLVPISDKYILYYNITKDIKTYDQYFDLLFTRRVFHYHYDFNEYFIEYDYSYSYNQTYPILFTKPSIERFENALIVLNNKNNKNFYKLKNSEISKYDIMDPKLDEVIDDYLLKMKEVS